MALDDSSVNSSGPPWRYFTSREVRPARSWAADGGIAVHENIYPSRGRRTCHLLGPDEQSLLEAALSVGCRAQWIQRTRTVHFDLVAGPLRAALRRCGIDPSLSPRMLRQLHSDGREGGRAQQLGEDRN